MSWTLEEKGFFMSGKFEENMRINEAIRLKLNNYPTIILAYYEQLISEGKSFGTAKLYVETILSFVDYMYAGQEASDFYTQISGENIQSYLETIGNHIRSEKTVSSKASKAQKWTSLYSFFQFLIPAYLSKNPVADVQRPEVERVGEMLYLNEEELKQIFSNARFSGRPMIVNRDLSILMLGFYRGLSNSEIRNLDMEDLDLINSKIRINNNGGTVEVSLASQITEQLKLWITDREQYFSDLETKAVFISQLKKRMSADSVEKVTRRYAEGIKKNITPQVMKNTCVVNLYKQTGDIHLCAKYLKHKNISTTQRYVDQLMENESRSIDEALTIMNSLIPLQYYEESASKANLAVTFSAKCSQLRKIRKEIATLNGIDFPMPECPNICACTGSCSLSLCEIQYLNAELNKKAVKGERLRIADITMDEIMEGSYGTSANTSYSIKTGQLSLF